jgi:hypothetical protein
MTSDKRYLHIYFLNDFVKHVIMCLNSFVILVSVILIKEQHIQNMKTAVSAIYYAIDYELWVIKFKNCHIVVVE